MAAMGQQDPHCKIAPLPEIEGERRTYEGLLQPFAAHAHDHCVIGRVREGRRRLTCNGMLHEALPGDLIVFNPGDVHACTQAGQGTFSYDSVAFSAGWLSGRTLAGPVIRDACAQNAFDDLTCAIDDGLPLERKLLALVNAIGISSAPKRLHAHESAVTNASSTLRASFRKPPSMDDLSADAQVSKHALIRAYKKRYSITPMRHLASFRVQRACKLLSDGMAPANVAAEVGFADQAHLTRTFKQQLGITPGAYRAMARGGRTKGGRAEDGCAQDASAEGERTTV